MSSSLLSLTEAVLLKEENTQPCRFFTSCGACAVQGYRDDWQLFQPPALISKEWAKGVRRHSAAFSARAYIRAGYNRADLRSYIARKVVKSDITLKWGRLLERAEFSRASFKQFRNGRNGKQRVSIETNFDWLRGWVNMSITDTVERNRCDLLLFSFYVSRFILLQHIKILLWWSPAIWFPVKAFQLIHALFSLYTTTPLQIGCNLHWCVLFCFVFFFDPRRHNRQANRSHYLLMFACMCSLHACQNRTWP